MSDAVTVPPFDPFYGALVAAHEAWARGDLGQAEGLCRGVLARAAEEPRALHILGRVLLALGDVMGAEGVLRRSAELVPTAEKLHDLGTAWFRMNRMAEAGMAFERAIGMGMDDPSTWTGLGYAKQVQGDPEGALECFRRAWKVAQPDQGWVLGNLVFGLQQLARWEEAEALAPQVAATALLDSAEPLECFHLLYMDVPASVRRDAARLRAARIQAQAGPPRFAHVPGDPAGRLRVGYLSADFHAHATSFLLAEVLERHDRSAVEVFAFSHGVEDGSPLRQRVRAAVDHFIDVANLTDAAAAECIHAAGIHVLVDLKGHTQENRLGIVARRPAPVLAHWLGYPGTVGGLVDAFIGDAVVTPPDLDGNFAERVVRLPTCYQPNDGTRPVAPCPPRADLGLPEGAVVFCGFNAVWKLNGAVWSCWMRILKGVPGSVLWLLSAHPAAAQALRAAAGREGVDPARLVFAPFIPNAEMPRHLARHQAADLFLDTWPYGAHTTASDALWAGLPVLTWAGEGFAARVAASLLHHLGLDELVAADAEDYVARAVALGNDVVARGALREKLAAARTRPGGPFDAAATARALEGAYRDLYADWVASTSPSPPRGEGLG